MQVTITGEIHDDPRSRVLAFEAAARAICERTGHDPAEAVMMLLTAAVHMHGTYSKKPVNEVATSIAHALGHALVAADDMFKLRAVQESPTHDR